ncbi:MAG: hypothetical protein HY558_06925, partial [Euryarchaeota archaeon]|nr:hypothetical protein [Euryarchaeota archaeon]
GLLWGFEEGGGARRVLEEVGAPVEPLPLREWGEFLEVRANLPRLLGRELRQKPRGLVGLGTVTDAYTPYEARSRLTRRCLQKLAGAGWPVSIQTKSRMVLRDLDILQHMEEVDVGLSFSTGDERTARILEPRASTLADRVFTLRSLRQNSIPTWAFLGPLLPGATEEGLEPLLDAIAATGTATLLVDPLRLKPGMWEHLERSLSGHPGWLRQWDHALQGGPGFRGLEERIRALARERGLKVEPGFPVGTRI